MSLSLSSLLNPSPDSETRHSPPPKDTVPHYVQSPIEQQSESPNSSRFSQHQFTGNAPHEAAQALASLSTSPAPPPQQWNRYSSQETVQLERQTSWERRQSGYGDPIQLPLPPPGGATRKMSSPTLDQYHVASRSPEQRRSSVVSPTLSNITLPPLQGFAPSSTDQTRRPSYSHNDEPLKHAVNALSHADNFRTSTQNGISETAANPDSIASSQAILPLDNQSSTAPAVDESKSSPASIKQEIAYTPQPASPTESRRPADMEKQTMKAVSSLKNEHGLRTQSPLRESSIPVPTTEFTTQEQFVTSKKRPAPSKTKKGTASAVKKEKLHPAKKRKVEPKRSATPSSRASRPPGVKGASGKGTPANSSPAPSTQSYSAEPNDEPYDDDEDEDMDEEADDNLYCICRKPDRGTFMIGCDGTCDDWFHGKCVGIEERDKNLIDKYICPNCTQHGVGRTTFKRMCRRGGCRQPAKVGKSKVGNSGSKYCSDECGVAYFREMVAKSRGREESGKDKSSRRNGNIAAEDDIGARGGAISAGEVKSLLNVSKTVEEFKKLGDGVLSPPATPDGKDQKDGSKFTDAETEAFQRILIDKEEARWRHALLKDRLKFITLAKQAASRTATEKELKPKEYCGYDPRIEWTEERFQTWRNGNTGRQAFELDTLQNNPKAENGEDVLGEMGSQPEICDRKKCARHHEWAKLAVDDLRFEMSDNGDKMRALDKGEKEIKERVALRATAGNWNGEGSVEVHGLGISTLTNGDKMDIDPSPKTNGIIASVEGTRVA